VSLVNGDSRVWLIIQHPERRGLEWFYVLEDILNRERIEGGQSRMRTLTGKIVIF